MKNSILEQLDKRDIIKTARKYKIRVNSKKALVFTLLDKRFKLSPSEISFLVPGLRRKTVLFYRKEWERLNET